MYFSKTQKKCDYIGNIEEVDMSQIGHKELSYINVKKRVFSQNKHYYIANREEMHFHVVQNMLLKMNSISVKWVCPS